MVKARIVGRPGRKGDTVVGTIRFLSENDSNLGEYPFSEKLADVAGMTTEEFEAHAVGKMKAKLRAQKLEEDWTRVQEVLEPLVVEAEP
jgi:hypothetical protein